MTSIGTSSKWPSYDFHPPSSSYLHSESEQTEDEADVLSEGEGDNVRTRKSLSGVDEVTLIKSYHGFPAHLDHLRCRSGRPEHASTASSLGVAALGSSSVTPGDLAFAQKCTDLRRFTRPLLDLLNGLKTGRFDKGLSSFQQSVAMDRLQKILGTLQRPEMGEKHLQNLLQIEIMLKIWFPQVAFRSTHTSSQKTTPRISTHWRKNQLHIPVKKRKMSWLDPDNSGTVLIKNKYQRHGTQGSSQAALHTISTPSPLSLKKQKTPAAETCEPAGSRQKRPTPEFSLHSPCGSPAAQDSVVSSSDSISSSDSPYLALAGHVNTRKCNSKPAE
ncbi:uncharacterized protein LOC117827561 [Xyrichtys novacula]|uniref:Uncharacterized protein LOC117827561 n=1 Tax=Xyrichtys novacula TaxID=13765 RepID=A0AAV1HET2_XYRNO|nr:uncharacterized protein LOC117827561 [Xyrichtys novacula]